MTDCVAELLSIRPLAQGYQVLTLHAPELAAEAQPGQFVHLQVPTLEPSRLRRPFSIYDAEPESGRLYILYKVVGFGTARLAAVTPGTKFNILGPIGRPFPLDPAGTPYLVGGGYGVAPLWFLSRKLPRKGVLFVGGRTAADILEVERFREAGWEVRVATQDGSLGEQGLVTVPLDAALAADPQAELFACGPDPMLRAVAMRATGTGSKGWISMDRHMICGVGACYACIQKTVRGNSRCCIEGPIFRAEDLVW